MIITGGEVGVLVPLQHPDARVGDVRMDVWHRHDHYDCSLAYNELTFLCGEPSQEVHIQITPVTPIYLILHPKQPRQAPSEPNG